MRGDPGVSRSRQVGRQMYRPGLARPRPECDSFSPPPHTPVNPVEDLLTAACSSIFPGAGTNQELALHCLHESRGDILVSQHYWLVYQGSLRELALVHVCCLDVEWVGGSDQGGGCSGSAQGTLVPNSRLGVQGTPVHPDL